MSKGSTIVPIRVPDELLGQLDEAVGSYRRGEPWTRSSFILYAVREMLKKRQRSRTWRREKTRKGVDAKGGVSTLGLPAETDGGSDVPPKG